jgi:hypothetical protein
MTLRTSAVAVAMLIALASQAAHAAGPTVDDCIAADTKAQSLRRDGKLRAAREQLATCASPSCPAMVKDDCTQRIDELQRIQPTIVFQVKNAQGQDLSDVTVSMDGAPLTTKLTGTALPLDLGDHQFVFTAPGYLRHAQHFVISEGQKDRHEVITLQSPTAETTTPTSPTPETTTPAQATTPEPGQGENPPPGAEGPKGSASPLRAVGITTLAVGLVGIGVGAGFGFDAMSKRDAANCPQNVCADQSSASTLVDAKQSANISTVFFVVGGVLAGGGTLMWLLAPSHKVRVEPTVGLGSLGLSLRGAW